MAATVWARDDNFPSLEELRKHAKKLRPREQSQQYQSYYNRHKRVSVHFRRG